MKRHRSSAGGRRRRASAISRHAGRPRLQFETLENRVLLDAFGITAFNDNVAGPATHAYTTRYADNGVDSASGQLRNIETGDLLDILVTASAVGGINFGSNGANPAAGTDASTVFAGYVDFVTASRNSIEISAASSQSYTYLFENLDPGGSYEFVGTAVRGDSSYTNRWTLVTISGADGFTVGHSVGSGVITHAQQPAYVQANQVALWTGANQLASQGWVVCWQDIDPGADGEFAVVSQQYTGPVPTSINPAGVANGSKGYGLNGIRLTEYLPTSAPQVVNYPAADIQAFQAELGGRIVSTGGDVPDVTVYYGRTDGGTNPAAWEHSLSLGSRVGDFSDIVGGLVPESTYYFTCYAENAVGGAWAPASQSFATLPVHLPQIVNAPVAGAGSVAAILAGEVVDTGNDAPLVTLYYGRQNGGTNPAAWEHSVAVGVQTGAFSQLVVDLLPETPYYFTARAQNAFGSVWAMPSQSFETTAPPSLVISEFMASNGTTLLTRTRTSTSVPFAGDYVAPDWIEIHNPTAAVAVLDGYWLSDDDEDPEGWSFPAGTTIAPSGYLVVFASGDSIKNPALDEHGFLHANFRLSAATGDVVLADPQGNVVSAFLDYPVQSRDISYGLGLDDAPRYFAIPTPNDDNAHAYPQAPQFSVPSSSFVDPLVVDLMASTPGSTIHYTLNGTAPTAASPVWTGPLTLTASTTIRALATGSDGLASTIVGQTYVRLASNVVAFNSNLPVVVVETFGRAINTATAGFGESFIAILEPGADGRTYLSEEFAVAVRAGIHIRGSSSAGFAKKQYRVEFWDQDNSDLSVPVLGMPAEADWILYGPGTYDRALINDPLVYELSNQMGRYAVRTRWVEMYINSNDGNVTTTDYAGVYAILEVIESGDERVEIEDLSTGAGGVPVEGGFIWRNDRDVLYQEPEVPTTAQRTAIDAYLNAVKSASLSSNPTTGYPAWIDVESFIDANLLNMLTMNVDALRLSSYYFDRYQQYTAAGQPTGVGTKLEAGPVWDFDRALESTDGRDDNPYWWNGTGDSTYYFNDNSRVVEWWPRLFQQPDFVQAYVDRWFELRETVFSLQNIYDTIDRHAAELAEAAPRDYARWSAARTFAGLPSGFAGEIQHMKTWLTNRINWIDSQWLARPGASVPGGSQVTPGTTVALSTATGGSIYYTLDGSDPRGPGGVPSAAAILATGPVTIDAATRIVARVRKVGHTPSSGAPGYIATGDDWSAPRTLQYYVQPPAMAGNLAITEINYNPYPATAEEALQFVAQQFEFIELRNVGTGIIDLTDARFTLGIDFQFTGASSVALAPGQYALLVRDAAAFALRYGSGLPVVGQFGSPSDGSGELDNGGETLRLEDRLGGVIQEFTYGNGGAWPGRFDGLGSSLEIVDPAGDYSTAANWRPSAEYGGSPGAAGSGPLATIVINEVLTHTDLPEVDTIELKNLTGQAIDVGGWFLSDSDVDYFQYRFPTDQPAWTTIPAGGYLPVEENAFGFRLSSLGEKLWLISADAAGKPLAFVEFVEFPAAANGESFGRWPDGTGILYPMTETTLGGPNSGPRVGPVIISEIAYAPQPPTAAELLLCPTIVATDFEFLEIYNPLDDAVNLTEWRIRAGVDYDFPSDTMLASRGTIVVLPFDPRVDGDMWAAFSTRYFGSVAAVPDNFLGAYAGKLDNAGETVRLQRPDTPQPEDPTIIPRLLVDEVDYGSASPWPTLPPDSDAALLRDNPTLWGHDPASWTAAAPTPGVYVPVAATVVDRLVFYNRSAFDGGDAAANAADDAAVATDKQALLPGGTATLANYTSYTRGINGIMVDLAGVADPAAITANDFTFRVGNAPDNWSSAPAPTSVTVRSGASGTVRVTIVWNDNDIQNQWLQVTVKATANTGLAADDVFYFGNAVGDSGAGNTPQYALVDQADELAVRAHRTGFAPTSITNVYDFDRDRRVGASDELAPRYLPAAADTALRLIAPPNAAALAFAAVAATVVAVPSVADVPTAVPAEQTSAPTLPSVAAVPAEPTSVATLPSVTTVAALQTGIVTTASVAAAAAVPAAPLVKNSAVPTRPRPAPVAHDEALASVSWLWAYDWDRVGPRKSATKKDSAVASPVDRVLAADWA